MSFKPLVINVDLILYSRADETRKKKRRMHMKMHLFEFCTKLLLRGHWTMNIGFACGSFFFCFLLHKKCRCFVFVANNRSEHCFFFFILHSFIYWKLSTWLLHFESHITFAWHLILYISIYHYITSFVVVFSFCYVPRTTFCRPTFFIRNHYKLNCNPRIIRMEWVDMSSTFQLKLLNWKQLKMSFIHSIRISNIWKLRLIVLPSSISRNLLLKLLKIFECGENNFSDDSSNITWRMVSSFA